MGARCSKLSVCWWPPHFESPMLGSHLPHIAPPPRILDVFFSSPAASSASAVGRRRRPAFGAAAFCFCCVFSGVFVVRFRGFRASVRWSWSRRSRWNSLRLAPIHPADLFGRATAIRILFCSALLSLISARFSARFDEFGCSREILDLNRVWLSAFLVIISWRGAMRS